MGEERTDFLKTYSNLPLKTRDEVIVVLDGRPITWNAAYIEVKNNTKVGREILIKLKNMGIL